MKDKRNPKAVKGPYYNPKAGFTYKGKQPRKGSARGR